jgi:hypothetical protein
LNNLNNLALINNCTIYNDPNSLFAKGNGTILNASLGISGSNKVDPNIKLLLLKNQLVQ